jgi:hypothetical protein
MSMREIWLAVSPSKKTVVFSSAPAVASMPLSQRIYNGMLQLRLGSRDDRQFEDIWLAVSEENTKPPT